MMNWLMNGKGKKFVFISLDKHCIFTTQNKRKIQITKKNLKKV